MSTCPVGCGRSVGPGKLMCTKCWSRVPDSLQNRVYATWRKYSGFSGIVQSDARRTARESYMEARNAAILAAGI
jgi:hypothetical protein